MSYPCHIHVIPMSFFGVQETLKEMATPCVTKHAAKLKKATQWEDSCKKNLALHWPLGSPSTLMLNMAESRVPPKIPSISHSIDWKSNMLDKNPTFRLTSAKAERGLEEHRWYPTNRPFRLGALFRCGRNGARWLWRLLWVWSTENVCCNLAGSDADGSAMSVGECPRKMMIMRF